MSHDNILGIGPILNGKVLDINMARLLKGDTVIDHIDRSIRRLPIISKIDLAMSSLDLQGQNHPLGGVEELCGTWSSRWCN